MVYVLYLDLIKRYSMGSDQTKIDDEIYESIAKYSELKPHDILAWKDRFLEHCQPSSATMNKEQFCKFYQELRPNENVKRLSENIFRAFDLNGDHGISFSEVKFNSNFHPKQKICNVFSIVFNCLCFNN